MILVDSSVWIDYFNGVAVPKTDMLHELLGEQPLIIGDIILTEVLQGFRFGNDFNTAKALLSLLPCYTLCGPELAIQSALNFRQLRKKGITIRKTNDVIIATFCIYHDYAFHSDSDFEPFQRHLGLRLL